MTHQRYGPTPERHAEIDAFLERAIAFFERLTNEVREAAASTNKQGHTVRQAETVTERIRSLRHALPEEQRWRTMGRR